MLDFRLETFLTLAKIGNFTKTAELLNITQPAVSQHIKFLEQRYGGKLFCYKGKTLILTERGKKLYDFALTVDADSKYLRNILMCDNIVSKQLNFGATLSIGEFACPNILARILWKYPNIRINMPVENTEKLLQKLRDGTISFAIVEGFFDKSEYGYELFSNENFIAVCGNGHHLAHKSLTLDDILSERIILRENGSGTRDVLEQVLYEHNLSINSFKGISEVGNINTIKHLVSNNLGITFLYRAAALNELENGRLRELKIQKLVINREFNFVYLKNSQHISEYAVWFDYFRKTSSLLASLQKEK